MAYIIAVAMEFNFAWIGLNQMAIWQACFPKVTTVWRTLTVNAYVTTCLAGINAVTVFPPGSLAFLPVRRFKFNCALRSGHPLRVHGRPVRRTE